MITAAPAAASERTIASPIPLFPPVTITLFPLRSTNPSSGSPPIEPADGVNAIRGSEDEAAIASSRGSADECGPPPQQGAAFGATVRRRSVADLQLLDVRRDDRGAADDVHRRSAEAHHLVPD